MAPTPSPSGSTPPSYSPLATFRVGGKQTPKPFVDVAQLKDHLALLHAFAELRIRVEGTSSEELGVEYFPPADEKERRWTVFVGFAVERFERWCKALHPADGEQGIAAVLPPLDVLMVWHSYLLNPGWYTEDSIRISALKGLWRAGKAFGASLGMGLGQLLDVPTSDSDSRVQDWVRMTQTPFDPFEAIPMMLLKDVSCPKCGTVNSAPFLCADGTGYLQLKFTRVCNNPTADCFFNITHDTLALRKLAEDLARQDIGHPGDLLAGTVYTPGNMKNLAHGRRVKSTLLLSPSFKPSTKSAQQDAKDIMKRANYNLAILKGKCYTTLKTDARLFQRIMNAYTDGRIFSVELVSAVLRQGSFVRKMYELGWTRLGAFKSIDEEVALWHSYRFMDLMSDSPQLFLVPTLDIDLAWHTHQLRSYDYYYDTKTYVGLFIDHDDKVEESKLSTSFDTTSTAWKKRFGVQYTYCGCPLLGDTVGQRLSRLVGTKGNPSYLQPPQLEKSLNATHPSDHDAVFPAVGGDKARDRLLKGKKGGKDDGPKCIQDPAFLVPVPLFVNAARISNCAASSGSIVNGERGGAPQLVGRPAHTPTRPSRSIPPCIKDAQLISLRLRRDGRLGVLLRYGLPARLGLERPVLVTLAVAQEGRDPDL
ncbi:hypothetical protein C8F01DRAFT_1282707 [Mycena amicta]|nr:hypothetical protein C8F01DRAFT_1282707 [Mycena amicta]